MPVGITSPTEDYFESQQTAAEGYSKSYNIEPMNSSVEYSLTQNRNLLPKITG